MNRPIKQIKQIKQQGKLLRIFWQALAVATVVVSVKFVLHRMGWEPIEQSSLHNSVISSVTFVIGFLLSATIADYKESEQIPAEFAALLEDMYDDAAAIHQSYPVFDLDGFRRQLHAVAQGFSDDVRHSAYDARQDIRGLTPYFATMEQGNVPLNFIVKLKQQQMVLLRHRHRIRFIPSASILARSIVVALLGLLLITNIDPFVASLTVVGLISFVLVYMIILIHVISTPFHKAGKTRDDVSLFLIHDAEEYLSGSSDTVSK